MTTGQSVFAQLPLPDYEDRVRIAEAYHLAESVQDRIWTGWSEVPFVILLVTSDFEYLIRHPNPPADFVNLGADPVVGSDIYARQNTGAFSINFLATFPAIEGVNTVVIGQAKTPTNHLHCGPLLPYMNIFTSYSSLGHGTTMRSKTLICPEETKQECGNSIMHFPMTLKRSLIFSRA
jgi:hypothetical protein